MNILITGASGILGSQVLDDITKDQYKITVISRAPWRYKFSSDIEVIEGDLCQPERLFAQLQGKQFDQIIHMAACVKWNQSPEFAMNQNVNATKNLLSYFQHQARKPHFIYVSTAFVDQIARQHQNLTDSADNISDDANFNNTYELSKYQAEQEVSASSLPWTILRPSIIIGHSKNGAISGFNGMYQLLKIYLSGKLPFMIGNKNSRLDLCPVDEVSAALKLILSTKLPKETVYYASSGQHAVDLGSLMTMAHKAIEQRQLSFGIAPMKPIPLISNEHYQRFFKPMAKKVLSGKQQHYLDLVGYFLPYLCIQGVRNLDANQNLTDPKSSRRSLQNCLNFWCDQNAHLFLKHFSKSPVETIGNQKIVGSFPGS